MASLARFSSNCKSSDLRAEWWEKSAKEDARELFKTLQLPEHNTIGERYPHQVSGGQLQRVMTAMAMSPRPDLIIFDEPTTALDVTTQVEVLSSIRSVVNKDLLLISIIELSTIIFFLISKNLI